MELIQYVRVARGPQKGNLRGVVIGTNKGIGWSFCHTTAQTTPDGKVIPPDRFNKQKGLMIARGRINLGGTRATVPHDVKPVIDRMRQRVARAFPRAPIAV